MYHIGASLKDAGFRVLSLTEAIGELSCNIAAMRGTLQKDENDIAMLISSEK